jgi:hypothetical protein
VFDTNDGTGQRYKIQNERKSDRIGKEIRILRATKKPDAAKFVLQNTDSWLPELPRNLTEGDKADNNEEGPKEKEEQLEAALRTRVLIRLANHTEIKKVISKFRQENPKWKEQLPDLLQLLGKKQRQKDEKAKAKRREEERKRRKERNSDSKKIQKNAMKKDKESDAEDTDLILYPFSSHSFVSSLNHYSFPFFASFPLPFSWLLLFRLSGAASYPVIGADLVTALST